MTTDTLRAAAQAVVDRWDTPNWKDAEPTAAVIGRLRAELAAPVQEPSQEVGEVVVEGVVGVKFNSVCGYGTKLPAGTKLYAAPQAAPAVPDGYVLVKAYSECGEFADDSPGLRADCAEKQRLGKPCERCPRRAARPQAGQAGQGGEG